MNIFSGNGDIHMDVQTVTPVLNFYCHDVAVSAKSDLRVGTMEFVADPTLTSDGDIILEPDPLELNGTYIVRDKLLVNAGGSIRTTATSILLNLDGALFAGQDIDLPVPISSEGFLYMKAEGNITLGRMSVPDTISSRGGIVLDAGGNLTTANINVSESGLFIAKAGRISPTAKMEIRQIDVSSSSFPADVYLFNTGNGGITIDEKIIQNGTREQLIIDAGEGDVKLGRDYNLVLTSTAVGFGGIFVAKGHSISAQSVTIDVSSPFQSRIWLATNELSFSNVNLLANGTRGDIEIGAPDRILTESIYDYFHPENNLTKITFSDVSIVTPAPLTINGTATMSASNTSGTGLAGKIQIAGEQTTLGGQLTLRADGTAGNIIVTGTTGIADNAHTTISAKGSSGSIRFTATNGPVLFAEPTTLDANGVGSGNGGRVEVDALGLESDIAANATALTCSAQSGESGGRGGTVILHAGRNVTAETSAMLVNARGATGNGGGISLSAGLTDQVNGTLSVNGPLHADATGNGNGGSIFLSAPNITLGPDSRQITANGAGNGNGGGVSIAATGQNSNVDVGQGEAAVRLSATSGTISGSGGSVSVSAGNNVSVDLSQIDVAARGNGNGGGVRLTAGTNNSAGQLSFTGTQRHVDVNGQGNGSGGVVSMTAPVIAVSGAPIVASANGAGSGNGGSIEITATGATSNVVISDGATAGFVVSANTGPATNSGSFGGRITLHAGQNVVVRDAAVVSAKSLGNAGGGGVVEIIAGTAGAGVANIRGQVDVTGPDYGGISTVTASSVTVLGSINASATNDFSSGGRVAISASNGNAIVGNTSFAADISANAGGESASSSSAGLINVSASNDVVVQSGSSLSVLAKGEYGGGGGIVINAGHNVTVNGAAIASGSGTGYGGFVSVQASNQIVAGVNSVVSADGNAGQIDIAAQGPVRIFGRLSTNSLDEQLSAGFISIAAGSSLNLESSTSVAANGVNGYIDFRSNTNLIMSGLISASAVGGSQPGTISATAGGDATHLLKLIGATVKADGFDGGFVNFSAGGNVVVDAASVVSANGASENGTGGSVSLSSANAETLVHGILRANGSGTGNGGTISLEYTSADRLLIDGGIGANSQGTGQSGEILIANRDPSGTRIIVTGLLSATSQNGTNATISVGDRNQAAQPIEIRIRDLGLIKGGIDAFGTTVDLIAEATSSAMRLDIEKIDATAGEINITLPKPGSELFLADTSYITGVGDITFRIPKLTNYGRIETPDHLLKIVNSDALRDLVISGAGSLQANEIKLTSEQGISFSQKKVDGTLSGKSQGPAINKLAIDVVTGAITLGDLSASGDISVIAHEGSISVLDDSRVLAVDGGIRLQAVRPDQNIFVGQNVVIRSISYVSSFSPRTELIVGDPNAIPLVVPDQRPEGLRINVADWLVTHADQTTTRYEGHVYCPLTDGFSSITVENIATLTAVGGTVFLGTEQPNRIVLGDNAVIVARNSTVETPIAFCPYGSARSSKLNWIQFGKSWAFSTTGLDESASAERIFFEHDGELLIEAGAPLCVVLQQSIVVKIAASAIVSIEQLDGVVKVRSLSGPRAGSIIVESPAVSPYAVALGHEFLSAANKDILLRDGVSRRNISKIRTSESTLFVSEFEPVGLCSVSNALHFVCSQTDPQSRKLKDRLLHSAACLSLITGSHGPFSQKTP